ncbi:MAG TPA: ABC transporter permease [Natronosporangium sp.]|nr:ABC transporter permease [Natronosporangium sp.]
MAAAVGVWELLRAVGVFPEPFVPSFGSIVIAAGRDLLNGTLLRPLATTLTAWSLGLAIAAGLGLVLGAAMGTWWWAAATGRILVRFLRPVPSVALIPVAILAAGLGLKMTLILVVFASVWPILINTAYGVREVPQPYRDTGRVAGLSASRVVLRVTVPAALPAVATGIRVSAAIALAVTIATELITGTGGLGAHIQTARQGAQFVDAYAGILLGGLIGHLINIVALGLERRVLFWSAEHRKQRS